MHLRFHHHLIYTAERFSVKIQQETDLYQVDTVFFLRALICLCLMAMTPNSQATSNLLAGHHLEMFSVYAFSMDAKVFVFHFTGCPFLLVFPSVFLSS